ncbi:UDP-N-acetylglucosamine 2-epimerase [Burkholderiales bacterium]|nr:UDP-N-acetylglucosamine 2-epimerase [Burkholderiales bacterium]
MNKKTIAVFTGNRAEYGLQFPVLKAINDHKELEYKLIVSGAHLDENFGSTLEEIKADGFTVDAEVQVNMIPDSIRSTAHAIGTGISSISLALENIDPDILLVYADRFEGFAAVIAGSQMGIPTAHIEGGDLTEGGALDDSVRHAMTKLSHLHFTTNQQATNRVLAMGEESWRVHTVGFPAIDLIEAGEVASPLVLEEKIGLDLERPVVLFTQHSVTTEYEQAASQVKASLRALQTLATEGVQVIITYPNNDVGGKKIINEIELFASQHITNVKIFRSLGRFVYHGLLALARDPSLRVACVGNSSSGIKETPVFGCPSVNIGSRQLGRLRAENVIDANYVTGDIYHAITSCLFDPIFRERAFSCSNPYGIGDAGIKIARVLAETQIDNRLIRKRMTLKGEYKEGGWCR